MQFFPAAQRRDWNKAADMFWRKKSGSGSQKESGIPAKPFISDAAHWGEFWDMKKEAFSKLKKEFKLNDSQLNTIELLLEHVIADERMHKSKYAFKPTFNEALAASLFIVGDKYGIDGRKVKKMFPFDADRMSKIVENAARISMKLIEGS